MSVYSFNHLSSPKNSTVGIADVILWAPVSAFTASGIKMPTPGTGTVVPGAEVLVTETHEFAAGEGFIKLLCAPGKNKFGGAPIGDVGSQKFDLKVDVFIPGTYKEVHEFVKNATNTPGIALIRDSSMGEKVYYQLGCDFIYAWLTTEWSAGEDAKSGAKGYKATLSCNMEYALLYSGDITLKGMEAPETISLDGGGPDSIATITYDGGTV